mmetsp:Transcript_20545/g.51727  ORF Transcript_20545/g.51727 Transcript_20545/m.51727 type:complete len:258 (+) Transcript_20545:470-1243(+)
MQHIDGCNGAPLALICTALRKRRLLYTQLPGAPAGASRLAVDPTARAQRVRVGVAAALPALGPLVLLLAAAAATDVAGRHPHPALLLLRHHLQPRQRHNGADQRRLLSVVGVVPLAALAPVERLPLHHVRQERVRAPADLQHDVRRAARHHVEREPLVHAERGLAAVVAPAPAHVARCDHPAAEDHQRQRRHGRAVPHVHLGRLHALVEREEGRAPLDGRHCAVHGGGVHGRQLRRGGRGVRVADVERRRGLVGLAG